ncbi:hypothetical protein VNO78_16042 [Psophocarpus tetragonolobus]|uniref:Uncharacterized protein n=1 Tax=Psophocarpus tetragonolobus TaxID=3891 RepID=A0AAN9SKH8_PSOTE
MQQTKFYAQLYPVQDHYQQDKSIPDAKVVGLSYANALKKTSCGINRLGISMATPMGMNLMLLEMDDSKDILEYLDVNMEWMLPSPFGEFMPMYKLAKRYDITRWVVTTPSKEVINLVYRVQIDELFYEIKI